MPRRRPLADEYGDRESTCVPHTHACSSVQGMRPRSRPLLSRDTLSSGLLSLFQSSTNGARNQMATPMRPSGTHAVV